VAAILAIDQGTTGTRAVVYGSDLKVRAKAYREHVQVFPQPGWVEHRPEEIWENTLAVCRQALRAAGLKASRLTALGITNQRETSVLWDPEGRPLHNAIVWQCRRSEGICRRLKARGLEKEFRRKTGLLLDPYFSGTKLCWLAEEVPAVRKAMDSGKARFGTIDTFLIWRLTGGKVHATDFTNASRTLLYDIRTGQWEGSLGLHLKVPPSCLPQVRASAGSFGITDPCLFDGARIPICGVAGDQQASLFGQGCWEAGEGKNTYGTGCFLLLNTGSKVRFSRQGLLTTLACGPEGKPSYALEGAVFIGGALIQWLRDGLKLFPKASDSEALALSVSDSAGVVIVPAFTGLGAPDWDPAVRGTLFGLTRGAGQGHLARAALEAIALQSAEVIDLMEQDAGLSLKSLRADGGATANGLLMQIQADVCQRRVEVSPSAESTALGAAALAALGSGLVKPPKLRRLLSGRGRVYQPRMKVVQAGILKSRYRLAVDAARSFKPSRLISGSI
jgi:glycerol kinase